MSVTQSVSVVEEFAILVVDDDDGVCELLGDCIGNVPKVKMKYLKEPESIEDYEVMQENFLVIILDILFDKFNKIEYLLEQVEEKWPDAIIIVLSYYEKELSKQQRKRTDAFINKTKLLLEPKLLRNKLIELIPTHKKVMEGITKEFLENLAKLTEAEAEVELYHVNGYVLRKKNEYMEVDICEKGTTGEGIEEAANIDEVRRKVLLPYEMFEKHDLCDFGTPIVFRIYRKGGQIIAEPRLDESADKPATIQKKVQKFLDVLEKKDERLSKDMKNNE